MTTHTNAAWIGGKSFDLFFFFGTSLIAILSGIVILAHPSWLIPAIWLCLIFSEGPHLIATWQRTYLDPDEWKSNARLLWVSLFPFLLCFGLLGISIMTGKIEAYLLLLLFASLWSWHHQLRQYYGIMALYEAKTKTPKMYWRFDKYFLHGFLWGVFIVAILTLPVNKLMLELPSPQPLILQVLNDGLIGLLMVSLVIFVGSLFYRKSRGVSVLPGVYLLFPVIGLILFIMFIFGQFEPVLSRPTNQEQMVIGMAILGMFVHGWQYLGVMIVSNRKRYADQTKTFFAARLGRSPMKFILFTVGVSIIFYSLLNGARSGLPGFSLFDENSNLARGFVALYWSLFFNHYYLDQKIWRIRKDHKIRDEFLLTPLPPLREEAR